MTNCYLCGNATLYEKLAGQDRQGTTTQVFKVLECARCGLAQTHPRPEIGEILNYYPTVYGPWEESQLILSSSPWFEALFNLLRKIKHLCARKKPADHGMTSETVKRVLEIGCGTGTRLEAIKKSHPTWQVQGIELAPRAVAAAQERGIPVQLGTVEEANLPSNTFDIVIMEHVIEHLTDPRKTLREIHRILAPGGELLVMCPNWDSIPRRIFRGAWYPLDLPRHLFFFTGKTFTSLLNEIGLETRAIHYDDAPKEILKSWSLLRGKIPSPQHPLLWHILRVLAAVPISRLHKSGIMTVTAIKVPKPD